MYLPMLANFYLVKLNKAIFRVQAFIEFLFIFCKLEISIAK